MRKLFTKILDVLNIHPDANQKWLLISVLLSGLLFTYCQPMITKSIITELPAQWLAAQAVVGSLAGLLIGVVWKGKLREKALRLFAILAIIESTLGCLLGMYLCFINYNVWLFAICSLFYTTFITLFVGKCVMAFKAKLWVEKDREVYDNNLSIVEGIVCLIGYSFSLIMLPSLKTALFLWGMCCIFDDIGWIIVFIKNKDKLIE